MTTRLIRLSPAKAGEPDAERWPEGSVVWGPQAERRRYLGGDLVQSQGGIEPALFGPSRDRGSGSCRFSGSQGQRGVDIGIGGSLIRAPSFSDQRAPGPAVCCDLCLPVRGTAGS